MTSAYSLVDVLDDGLVDWLQDSWKEEIYLLSEDVSSSSCYNLAVHVSLIPMLILSGAAFFYCSVVHDCIQLARRAGSPALFYPRP